MHIAAVIMRVQKRSKKGKKIKTYISSKAEKEECTYSH